MPTATVSEANCPAGVETDSPSVVIPTGLSQVSVQLSSTEWAAKAGTGTLTWGLSISRDGGLTWDWWLYQPLAIGAVSRGGGLPTLRASASTLLAAAGSRVRLFALPSVAIQLGALVTWS